MKTYFKQIKQVGKAAVLGTAALFYACAPKGGANLTIPTYEKPQTEQPTQEKFKVIQPLDFIYNKARKQIAKPENFTKQNPLYEKVTNQNPYLETKGGGLEDLILTEEETKKK